MRAMRVFALLRQQSLKFAERVRVPTALRKIWHLADSNPQPQDHSDELAFPKSWCLADKLAISGLHLRVWNIYLHICQSWGQVSYHYSCR